MITISITAEALAAIEATLPEGREADRRPDGKGSLFIALPHDVLNKLDYVRGPGESSRRPDLARRSRAHPSRSRIK